MRPPLAYGSDQTGLVCGFRFAEDGIGRAIGADEAMQWIGTEVESAETQSNEFIWLHFSLANVATERWIARNLTLPDLFYETLKEGSRSTRVEFSDDHLIAVLNDVLFDFAFDASHISTVVLSVGPRMVVTARSKPLRSLDHLRAAVKDGAAFRSSVELLVHLLQDQADSLVSILRDSTKRVDEIEDQLLAGSVEQKRADLGQLRRVLVRLKRLLAPEPAALFRLLSRPPQWMAADDLAQLRESTEEFSVALNDIDTLQERIKLLQEEISARVQEQNNRSLFVLSIFTVLALPVNMIAGLFGMNVGGIPLAQDNSGFWIIVSLVITITSVAGWWAFTKRKD